MVFLMYVCFDLDRQKMQQKLPLHQLLRPFSLKATICVGSMSTVKRTGWWSGLWSRPNWYQMVFHRKPLQWIIICSFFVLDIKCIKYFFYDIRCCCCFVVGGKEYPRATGKTKKEAKEEAAKLVFQQIHGIETTEVSNDAPWYMVPILCRTTIHCVIIKISLFLLFKTATEMYNITCKCSAHRPIYLNQLLLFWKLFQENIHAIHCILFCMSNHGKWGA